MNDRKIRIVRGFSGYKEGSLCFKTGTSPDITYNFALQAYEDEGPNYGPFAPTALQLLYERLTLGDTFPSEMILTGAHGLQHICAAALFTSPELVLTSECMSFVHSVSMATRWGDIASAHLSEDHLNVLLAARNLIVSEKELSRKEEYIQLMRASSVMESYLKNGVVPPEIHSNPSIDILKEEGSFVVFESNQMPWSEIYAKGYLAGIWLIPSEEDEALRPCVFKKSSLVQGLDLEEIGRKLNVNEFGVNRDSNKGWTCADDPTFLRYPEKHPVSGESLKGTSLSLEEIVDVVLEELNSE